jgi:hypothetical protein
MSSSNTLHGDRKAVLFAFIRSLTTCTFTLKLLIRSYRPYATSKATSRVAWHSADKMPPEQRHEAESQAPASPPIERGPVVSAPPTREGAGTLSGSRPTESPTSVRLTPEQREIARAAGLSDVDYARNLLRMREMKRAGLIQDAG